VGEMDCYETIKIDYISVPVYTFCFAPMHVTSTGSTIASSLSIDAQYFLLPLPLNLYFFSVDFGSYYYKIGNMPYET
jgi:hypothetical protein